MLFLLILIIVVLVILYNMNSNKNENYTYTKFPIDKLTPEQKKEYGYYNTGVFSPRAGPTHQGYYPHNPFWNQKEIKENLLP